jgi:hypothetical protein
MSVYAQVAVRIRATPSRQDANGGVNTKDAEMKAKRTKTLHLFNDLEVWASGDRHCCIIYNSTVRVCLTSEAAITQVHVTLIASALPVYISWMKS